VTTRAQTFTLSGFTDRPTVGTVTILEFSSRERWRRSLQALGKWWGVALLSVFIPVAHFLLVPSFLLYGVLQFVQRIGTAQLATNAQGTCPDCGRSQSIEVAPRWRAPQTVTCRYCQRGLQLVVS
jgi:hypothetical protein